MKRMLINATQAEELRVAIADGQKLIDLDLETPAHEQKKANVYKARITRVEHSLEACFVNYGSERHGFLPFKEINPSALPLPEGTKPNNVNLKDVLREGQELIVQVEKEERGTKGAALSTYISLAGRYSVLMPNSPKSGGVSRRISGEERDQIRSIMDQLDIPKDTGLIIRTAGVGRDIEELQWDLDYLKQLWTAIEKAAGEHKAPFLIYQESNLIIRALRDYLRDDITEILIDDEAVYQSALEFMQLVMPYNLRKLKQYQSEAPLFTRYQIESQIETAFAREVTLPSGGSLVIDHTEALLSIDINSARATKGSDIEETAFHTNLEAADEIARQLRIRDLGGLVVIDFIDMLNRGNQRKVEERIRDALSYDRARIQTGRISKFGLLEMSRQRMRPSIGESSYQVCPRCIGHGSIRSVESLALSMIRLIEEEAIKEHSGQIVAQAPTKVANFMHNEKRDAISTIEKRHDVPILLLANPDMNTPRFEIKRLRTAEVSGDPSYLQVNLEEGEVVASETTKSIAAAEKPAVSGLRPTGPAPQKRVVKKSFWASILAFFTGSDASEGKPRRSKRKPRPARKKAAKPNQQRHQSNQNSGSKKTTKRVNQRKKTGKKTGRKKTSKKVAQKQNPNQNQAQKQGQNQNNQNNNATDANTADGNTNTPRRRGKRGGRKRRSRQSPQQQNNQNPNNNQQAAENQQQGSGQNAGNQGDSDQNTANQNQGNGNSNQNARPQNSAQQTSNQINGNQAKPAQDNQNTSQQKSQPEQGSSAQASVAQASVDRAPSQSGQKPPVENQSAPKPADQHQSKVTAETSAKTHNQDRTESQSPGQSPKRPPAQTQNQTEKPAQDQRSNQSQKPAQQQSAAPNESASQPASSNAPAATKPATNRPASPNRTSGNQSGNESKPASNANKPAQPVTEPPKSPSAAPAQKPADQVKSTGPSAKPEAVKGIYSLGETPAPKPAKPAAKPPSKPSGSDKTASSS